MFNLYSRMNAEERRKLYRFLVCITVSLILAWAIGYPGSGTIGVSAILMLYVDRGYAGSLLYNKRRIQTQILMGGMVLIFSLALGSITNWEKWFIGMIAVNIAVLIGLPLDFKYNFAPLNVTLGNSALIMSAGIIGNPKFYLERVMYCILGAIIAYIVNFYVLPAPDRFLTTLASLVDKTKSMFTGDKESWKTIHASVKSALPQIEKDIGLLEKDKDFKYRIISSEELQHIHATNASMLWLLATQQAMLEYDDSLSDSFRQRLGDMYERAVARHGKLFAGETVESEPAPEIPPANAAEVHALHALLEYWETLARLAANPKPEKIGARELRSKATA